MTTSKRCVFCDIVEGRAPASIAYKDDTVIAFMDINPLTPGHLLVAPVKHLPALADVDAPTGMQMFAAASRLAGAVRQSGLPCEGVNLFLADGAVAGQEVFHAHLHVIPRWAGDGVRIVGDWTARPDRTELDTQARLISSLLER